MKFTNTNVTLSATDLANHLSCKHLTELNRSLAKGTIAPQFALSEWFWCEWGIPLNPPLKKGDFKRRTSYSIPPFAKGGQGGFHEQDNMKPYNKNLKHPSRELRKNMTDAECLLWSRVRRKQIKGLQFYRQKPLGSYIVDFYCPAANLVVEIDGGQHYTDEGKAKDKRRDDDLAGLGLKVLRFSNVDVLKEIDAVLQVIWENVESQNRVGL